MQIEQATSVAFAGDSDCNHAFIPNGSGKLRLLHLMGAIFGLCEQRKLEVHNIERICFRCLRHEVVSTVINWTSPFTFEAANNRLQEKMNS